MKLSKLLIAAVGASALISMAPTNVEAADGKKVWNKCKACHTLKAGKHKVGPSLAGVVGRKAGTADGFKKYKGLKGADWTWDEASLNEFLTNPRKYTKGKTGKNSSMVLKLKKEKDRMAIIEYLKSQ